MTSQPAELFGDVITLSSGDDELIPGQKRSREASSVPQDPESDSHPTKKTKTTSPSRSGSAADGASEEGEIDENQEQNRPGQPPPMTDMPAGTGNPAVSDDGKPGNGKSRNGKPGTFVPAKGPVYEENGVSFILPVYASKREGSWEDRFKEWVRVFYTHNIRTQPPSVLSPSLAFSAYLHYLETMSGLKLRKRRNAKISARSVLDSGALESLLKDQKLQQRLDIGHTGPSQEAQNGGIPETDNQSTRADAINLVSDSEEEYEPPVGVPPVISDQLVHSNDNGTLSSNGVEPGKPDSETPSVTAQEMSMIRRYFPSADGSTPMCLNCGRAGHFSSNCSYPRCRFCSSTAHEDFACPTRARCRKCRQLGHDARVCVEKLALTKEEGLACSFCGEPNHLEDKCTLPWRSFHPGPATIRKVQFLQPACALCGGSDHYYNDCPERRDIDLNPSWSMKNRDQYVDSASSYLSIEEASKASNGPTVSQRPELKIRGRAAKNTNVHYSESDDSDVEFLGRKPVPKRGGTGSIRMASNIQMPQNSSANGVSTWQPPLPPGPPPSEPPPPRFQGYRPPSSYDSLPPRPPPSLPPKPPGRDHPNAPPPPQLPRPQHGQSWRDDRGRSSHQPASHRGGSRGGRGGRGGGRGRGRGRGRGN